MLNLLGAIRLTGVNESGVVKFLSVFGHKDEKRVLLLCVLGAVFRLLKTRISRGQNQALRGRGRG
jgi:hypothetical protein